MGPHLHRWWPQDKNFSDKNLLTMKKLIKIKSILKLDYYSLPKIISFLIQHQTTGDQHIFGLVLLTFCLVIQRIGLLTIPDAWPTAKTMQWEYLVIMKSILRFSAFHCLMKHTSCLQLDSPVLFLLFTEASIKTLQKTFCRSPANIVALDVV